VSAQRLGLLGEGRGESVDDGRPWGCVMETLPDLVVIKQPTIHEWLEDRVRGRCCHVNWGRKEKVPVESLSARIFPYCGIKFVRG